MSTLHIVFAAELPEALARSWSAGDALLLAGACVSAALQLNSAESQNTKRPSTELPAPCFALDDAVCSRGLSSQWPTHIPRIGHSEWLDLLTQHQRSLSWS